MNGELYVAGGCDVWACLNSVEKYNPESDSWSLIAPLNVARRGCGLACLNGRLYAIGGHDGTVSLCSVEVYDPDVGFWVNGPTLTSCRANVGVAVVGDRLYAIGGFNGNRFLNTIEYLDIVNNEWTGFLPKKLSNDWNDKSSKNNETSKVNNGIEEKVSKTEVKSPKELASKEEDDDENKINDSAQWEQYISNGIVT